MSKKLAELFNLPDQLQDEEVTAESAVALSREQQEVIEQVDETIDKIDLALPTVRGLTAGDNELDELADLAKKSAQDLLDLGMAMEARFSGTVFQTAGVMLGHAITAKQAKLDKKLKMVDLQLKKMRVDQQAQQLSRGAGAVAPEPIEGQGQLLDRNALLAEILAKSK
jgi:hypothetical protein